MRYRAVRDVAEPKRRKYRGRLGGRHGEMPALHSGVFVDAAYTANRRRRPATSGHLASSALEGDAATAFDVFTSPSAVSEGRLEGSREETPRSPAED